MNELSVTRFIHAPPDKVWDAMANRREEWWCPSPWTVTLDRDERRPGGACDMTMRGPDGEVMPSRGIYLAWDEGRRFVTTDALDADFQPTDPFMVGLWAVESASEDGREGTRYTASARHWTEEARDRHREMGFEEGWGICADQLKALCETG